MKIILSRKGFDSGAGGVASPILPDGTMLSLPIPDRSSPIRYADVRLHGNDLGPIVEALTRGKKKAHFGAHLDPDVVPDALPRLPGWQPTFGQAGGEQTVLVREGVGPGDVFLFFGWFRDVVQDGAVLRYRRGAPNLHVLWGWMQVAQIVDVATGALPEWVRCHPHVAAPALQRAAQRQCREHVAAGAAGGDQDRAAHARQSRSGGSCSRAPRRVSDRTMPMAIASASSDEPP